MTAPHAEPPIPDKTDAPLPKKAEEEDVPAIMPIPSRSTTETRLSQKEIDARIAFFEGMLFH